jgi:hypothetical protein
VGDFGNERATHISLADYVRHVLCIRTPQFRQHPLFQFVSFDRILKAQLFASVRMNISGVPDAEALMLSRVTPTQLGQVIGARAARQEVQDAALGPASQLLRRLALSSCKAAFSQESKSVNRNELQSTIIALGVPFLYVTISPSDVHHPLAFSFCQEPREALDLHTLPPALTDKAFRQRQAAKNPVGLALFFGTLIEITLDKLFGGAGVNGVGGVFGPLSAHYGMVECQNRGTLHIHLLLWVRGSPSPEELRARMEGDPAWRDSVLAYLEGCILTDPADVQAPASAVPSQASSSSGAIPLSTSAALPALGTAHLPSSSSPGRECSSALSHPLPRWARFSSLSSLSFISSSCASCLFSLCTFAHLCFPPSAAPPT